jgi:hypothetical protein
MAVSHILIQVMILAQLIGLKLHPALIESLIFLLGQGFLRFSDLLQIRKWPSHLSFESSAESLTSRDPFPLAVLSQDSGSPKEDCRRELVDS